MNHFLKKLQMLLAVKNYSLYFPITLGKIFQSEILLKKRSIEKKIFLSSLKTFLIFWLHYGSLYLQSFSYITEPETLLSIK